LITPANPRSGAVDSITIGTCEVAKRDSMVAIRSSTGAIEAIIGSSRPLPPSDHEVVELEVVQSRLLGLSRFGGAIGESLDALAPLGRRRPALHRSVDGGLRDGHAETCPAGAGNPAGEHRPARAQRVGRQGAG